MPIFAYYKPSLFCGELYKQMDGVFHFFTSGQVDLNVSNVDKPLMPKDSTFAFVPDFYNKKGGVSYLLKTKGNYRFKVYYSLNESSFGYRFYQSIANTEYWLQENKLFEVSYDFLVK